MAAPRRQFDALVGRALIAVVIPVAMAHALAASTLRPLWPALDTLARWILASAVVGMCLVVVRSRVTNDLLTHLRQAIEDGLLYGPLPGELRAPGELSMRLTTDAGTLVANIVGAVVEVPLAAATLALLGVYGWHMDAALAVIVLGPVPLYFVLPMIMGAPASRRTDRGRVAQSGALTRTIGAMLLHNVNARGTLSTRWRLVRGGPAAGL